MHFTPVAVTLARPPAAVGAAQKSPQPTSKSPATPPGAWSAGPEKANAPPPASVAVLNLWPEAAVPPPRPLARSPSPPACSPPPPAALLRFPARPPPNALHPVAARLELRRNSSGASLFAMDGLSAQRGTASPAPPASPTDSPVSTWPPAPLDSPRRPRSRPRRSRGLRVPLARSGRWASSGDESESGRSVSPAGCMSHAVSRPIPIPRPLRSSPTAFFFSDS